RLLHDSSPASSFAGRSARNHAPAPIAQPRVRSVIMKKTRKTRSRRLQYEPLESRQLMAVTAGLSGGALTANGTTGADTINFKQVGSTISINGVSGSWSATKVKSIDVRLNGGNDSVSLNSFANGGTKALAEITTVRGGLGIDVVHLASGKDVT